MVCVISCSGDIMDISMNILYGSYYGMEGNVVQCKSCNETYCIGCYDEITQKRIWNVVRVSSSQLVSVKKVENVKCPINNLINWNQSSDRSVASIQKLYRPTNGNSTKTSITRERPGSQSPGGIGVDVKHNSYDRYLSKRKACHLKTESSSSVAIKGNKTKAYGFLKTY